MSLEDSLILERYRLVTDRQKYFTELARAAFATYIKIFTALGTVAIALVSVQSKLAVDHQLLIPLIDSLASLVSFLGLVTIGQIVFCLARWKGFREAERAINPASPRILWWWWMFETLYVVAVAVSISIGWLFSSCVSDILESIQPGA